MNFPERNTELPTQKPVVSKPKAPSFPDKSKEIQTAQAVNLAQKELLNGNFLLEKPFGHDSWTKEDYYAFYFDNMKAWTKKYYSFLEEMKGEL